MERRSPARSWRHLRAHPMWLSATAASAALLLAGLLFLTLSSPGGQVAGSRVAFRAPPGTPSAVLDRAALTLRERLRSAGITSRSVEVDAPGEGVIVEVPQRDVGTLEGLGRVRRLEEREAIAQVPAEDVAYTEMALTPIDRSTGLFETADPDGPVVSFEDTNGDGAFTDGVDVKYQLGGIEVTGADVKEASAQFSAGNANVTGGWRVVFTLTDEGSRRFADVTTRLVGKQLAILVDGVVLSVPTVQSPITGGQGEVTGSYPEGEAKDLAAALDAPPLPVALTPSSPEPASVQTERLWPVTGIVMVGLGAVGLASGLILRPHARWRVRRDLGGD